MSRCRIWKGKINQWGYGLRCRNYRGEYLAHRVAWMKAKRRDIPDGLLVCHHCDNPLCVNPDHLFIGTQADNMRDKFLKGRARGKSFPGDTHPQHKLTSKDVLELRKRYALGERVRNLAAEKGVGYCCAYQAIHRINWKCI